ncbi:MULTISPECIES: hypothetical protein [unclassified Aeromicrobium]|uniref:hypothetical protein n=1 Tax=unclassified Aeromicrobium TaxID=2633570 RepID=UPI002889BE63|nr:MULTISPECIES: hypothetical protein [unclassified Aeromicrobium]
MTTTTTLTEQANRQETAVIERETAYMRTLAGVIATTVREAYPTAATVLLGSVYDDDGDEQMRFKGVQDADGVALLDLDEADPTDALEAMEWTYVTRLNLHGPTVDGWAQSADMIVPPSRRTDGTWRLRIDDAIAAASRVDPVAAAVDALTADRDAFAALLSVAVLTLGGIDEDEADALGLSVDVVERAAAVAQGAERLLIGTGAPVSV